MTRCLVGLLMVATLICGGCKSSSDVGESNSVDLRKQPGTKDEYFGSVTNVEIVGDERGWIAPKLCQELSGLFKLNNHIEAAYLVQAKYGKEQAVACLLKTNDWEIDQQLKNSVFSIFRRLRGTNKRFSLDLLVADEDVQPQLDRKATPFYVRSR